MDLSARIVGYGLEPNYINTICTLILSKKDLRPGLYRGTELPDPKGLMIASGILHKYVELNQHLDLNDISDLLNNAFRAYLFRKKLNKYFG